MEMLIASFKPVWASEPALDLGVILAVVVLE